MSTLKKTRKRVRFVLLERIRDHDECFLYEVCLDAAAKLNAPRVCWEGCDLYRPPKPNKALEMAETLEHIQSLLWRFDGDIIETTGDDEK